VANKWNQTDRRIVLGRLPTPQEVVDSTLKIARDNVAWGYDRIADALANLGQNISDQTVGNILKARGIDPVPSRKRQVTWSSFLKAHRSQLAAIVFTTIEVCSKGRLTTFYLVFVRQLATRRVHFAGCTTSPVGP